MLRDILADAPRHVSARNILGLCLTRRKRYREAEHEYLQSLATDPGQFRVRGALGSVALLRGDLDAATSHFEAALRAAPTFVEAMANLGFIRALRGDESGARAWYEKAVAADPNLPLAHRRLGDLHYEAERYADALRYYEKTLEVAPSDFRAAIQAGNCAKRTGDGRRAEAHYRRAGELRKDSWIPPYNLACLWATTGRTDEALAALDQARTHGLDDPPRLESDADLASLRGLPRFRQLLASMGGGGTT
jgi:tetratricopeptide (TPR) repeat protein